jgi:putative DNA primase/helicase
MPNKLDQVRSVLGAAEDIDMDGMPPVPPLPIDQDPPCPPDDDGPPPEADCVGIPMNDYGNGLRFVTHHGEDLMYVPRVGWFTWTGKLWQKDPDMIAVRRLAQGLGALIEKEVDWMRHSPEDAELVARAGDFAKQHADLDAILPADRSPDQVQRLGELTRNLNRIRDARTRLGKAKAAVKAHARGAGNSPKIKAAIGESETKLARRVEDLDAHDLTVNCDSGALIFSTSLNASDRVIADVRLVPHARDQLLTKIMPAAWTPKAPCPLFDAFLERVQPDAEMRGFIQRWLGLSLTGLTGEQKLAFFYGSGANGKSVLVDLFARLMGDYSATAKIESLTGRNKRSGGDATPDLVPLIGARMVRASEPEEGERMQEAKIKELTGGEPILIRALNEDFLEVTPKFKLTISGNHKPEIRGNDDGIWRRMMLVPFDVQIPAAERDPALVEKLWQEREGILQWAVEGLLDYLELGLREPDAVLAATTEYREESDPLGNFLADCCIGTGDASDNILSADLTRAFNFWLVSAGGEMWKGTTIQRQLAKKAKGWRHPKTGNGMTKAKSSLSQYEGIRFTDVFKNSLNEAPRDRNGNPTAASTAPQPQGETYDDF